MGDDFNRLPSVGFLKADIDTIHSLGRKDCADKIGLNGNLAMTPVDQDREFHLGGPPVIKERVKSGPDGSSGKDDVIHQNNVSPVDRKIDFAALQGGVAAQVLVVIAVKRNIQDTQSHVGPFAL